MSTVNMFTLPDNLAGVGVVGHGQSLEANECPLRTCVQYLLAGVGVVGHGHCLR
jgi:hypothetical protein